MQTLLQLNPPIPLQTPRGEGSAVLVIDYGPDHDLWWTVILSKGEHAGEVWTYPNPQVRGVENITLGRHVTSRPPVEVVAERAKLHDGAPEVNGLPRPGALPESKPLNGRDRRFGGADS